MANVIGVPLVKGNSEVLRACRLRSELIDEGDYTGTFEGMAVFDGGEQIEINVNPTFAAETGTGKFVGFVFDINQCSGFATLIRSAESVCLPTDGTVFAKGDVVKVDPVTGLISAAGTISTNGVVVKAGTSGNLEAIDGKTGARTTDCVVIRIIDARAEAVVVVAAKAPK